MTTSSGRALAYRLLSVLGFILSCYALYVEHKVSSQKLNGLGAGEEEFVALCDLGYSWAKCSSVLTSETSHLFGPPNALLGAIFYVAVFLYPTFTFVPYREYLLFGAVAFSCGLTIYLASVLYRMGDFCVLCVSTYVINWTFLFITWREIKSIGTKKNKKSL